ncbi:MAG: hypothetical protein AB7O59_00960 [Pirellulales bacterium]
MAYLESTSFVWTLGFVQFAGLVSAWLARMSEGSRGQSSCHWLFLACLGLIGMGTMVSVSLGPRYLLFSCLTLSIMVLVAVWDFRAEARHGHI